MILCCFFLIQMESGGTVLSTNWDEVGKGEVKGSPPDGKFELDPEDPPSFPLLRSTLLIILLLLFYKSSSKEWKCTNGMMNKPP